jgi:diketogulonate reductase-like aldo/keto reductase
MAAPGEGTAAPSDETVFLSNELSMPAIGFGCAGVDGEDQETVVHAALEAGYRLFDNASLYGNEKGIGRALRSSGIPREELFISSSLRNKEQGYDKALSGFTATTRRLGVEYLDLYLIHWPMPARGLYAATWRAFEELYEEGLVRAIGVSNFERHHLDTLLKACDIPPMVNQIECNPYLANSRVREYCRLKDIAVQAWCPLGGSGNTGAGLTADRAPAPLLQDETILDIAAGHGRTPAQVVLRWEIQLGMVPLPKSVRPERIKENYQVFDFALTSDEMQRIASLECNRRTGAHPDEFNDLV